MNKNLLMAGVVAASAVALTASTPALATTHAQITDHKVGICHATGSKTNPYVFIVVDKHAAAAHAKHQDERDVIGVTSADKCPKPVVSNDKPAADNKKDDNGKVLSATTETAPTKLPDTGAGLSALIGLPTLALAGRAYLRSRLS